MVDEPVNVDGIRRMLNVSPEEMSDADLRKALAVLAADCNPNGVPEDVAEWGTALGRGDRPRPADLTP